MFSKQQTALLLAAGLISSVAFAAPVSIDGAIGAEWGAPSATVGYSPSAADSNFGAPEKNSKYVGYDIYTRADSNYFYGALQAAGDTNGLNFANLYFNVDGVNGSDLGLELTNERFFIPGVPGYQADTNGLVTYVVGNGIIEFAIDFAMFLDNPYGMSYTATAPGGNVTINLSQSFGYSVAGGQNNFGDARLGTVQAPSSVPEPAPLALFGIAFAALGFVRRRAG
jgi:hypothetical protein